MNILLINGVNLNLLGTREPEIYGSETLSDVEKKAQDLAKQLKLNLRTVQSNHEGEIVEYIQSARGNTDWIIINAGAFTHTSIAIRDALSGVGIPFVEVHLSNVYAREAFRHHSYLSDKARGVIAGLGSFGYQAALQFIATQHNS